MTDFNHEQMFRAINALSSARVVMATYGQFYVEHSRVEICNRHAVQSVVGRGATADEAIADHFRRVTQPGHGHWVVINAAALGSKRTAYRWNDFMWLAIDEAEERARAS